MSTPKKRKVEAENRVFQIRWEEEYFFTSVSDSPVCLVCNEKLSVNKEYNIKRHFTSKHEKDITKLSMTMRVAELARLKEKLQSKSGASESTCKSDNALRAGLIIADLLAHKGKPFTDGPLVKECLVQASNVVCPEATESFQMISLSAKTIARRTELIAGNLESQLRAKCPKFTKWSLAIDESTDTTDIAQLAVFVRGVDESMTVVEELLGLVPLHDTTTGNDLFVAVVTLVDKSNLCWENFAGLATDGAAAMKGEKKHGLLARLRAHLKSLNLPADFPHVHCIIHQEALCASSLECDNVMDVVVKAVNKIRAQGLNHRQFKAFLEEIGSEYGDVPYYCKSRWLSRAKVLKTFFDLRSEIEQFLTTKKVKVPELQDTAWLQDLAFLVDITGHLNELNIKLQGKGKVISDMYATVQAFEMRLEVFTEEMQKGEFYHFPALASLSTVSVQAKEMYSLRLQNLQKEFSEENFADLRRLEKDINIFSDPFSVDLHSCPPPLKLELIDLRVNKVLKSRFDALPLAEFCALISPVNFPRLHAHFSKMLALFGSTYVCEQFFSLMKYAKNRFRSRLSDGRLHDQLRIMARNDLVPDFDTLVSENRSQISPNSM